MSITISIATNVSNPTILLANATTVYSASSIECEIGDTIQYAVKSDGYYTEVGKIVAQKTEQIFVNLNIIDKSTNYDDVIQEIKDYYANLLIIQYHNKPKAVATVKKTIETLLSDAVLFKIRDGFNLETAVGKQLDTLAEWVGLYSRVYDKGQPLYPWFSYIDWSQTTTDDNQGGFQDWDETTATDGGFLGYNDIVIGQNATQLNDEGYRSLIKLQILKNTTRCTMKDIDDKLYELFGNDLYVTWGYSSTQLTDDEPAGMSLTYNYANKYSDLMQLAKVQNILPVPTGMLIKYNEL